jgi:hypothetical protein
LYLLFIVNVQRWQARPSSEHFPQPRRLSRECVGLTRRKNHSGVLGGDIQRMERHNTLMSAFKRQVEQAKVITDADILAQHHQFLREDDEEAKTWEDVRYPRPEAYRARNLIASC